MKCLTCKEDFVKLSPEDKHCSTDCRSRWAVIVEEKEQERQEKEQKRLDKKNTRICPQCKKKFIKHHNRQKYCDTKTCGRRAVRDRWKSKNKGKVKDYKREYYYRNRESILAYQREWRLKKEAEGKKALAST